MKKIIILMTMLFIVLFHIDTYASTAKKIDLRTKEDEINIIFLKLQNSISLVISDINSSKLFFIKHSSDKGINKALKIFDIKPEIFSIDNSGYVDDLYIKKTDYISIKINNYDLCIVEDKKEVKGCDFIYLLTLNEEFNVDDNTSVVFYDENIKDDFLVSINESWIDSHIVSLDSFTILKLNKEEYNILVVPLENR